MKQSTCICAHYNVIKACVKTINILAFVHLFVKQTLKMKENEIFSYLGIV